MRVIGYLGHGIGRAVCELENNVVIKVPFNSNGIRQNREEFEKYSKEHGMLAKIVDYDKQRDWIYMEKVKDVSEYFNDYIRDGVHCETYDELDIPYKRCWCDGKCYTCPHNILSELVPKNVDEIIEQKPKDRLQVGINKDGEYKYFDYSDFHEVEKDELKFYDSLSQMIIDYLTEEPEISFEQFIKNQGDIEGQDNIDYRQIYKKTRIAWTKWNNEPRKEKR